MHLRRITLEDAELLEAWQSIQYTGGFNDFGVQGGPLSDAIRRDGLVGAHGGSLIVELEAGQTPVGTVSWREVRYGPNPESAAWQIGINLIPEGRGQGFGGEAQRALAVHLFATTPVNRVEAMTDIDNVAEQRSLEKAGYVREGMLRGAQYRAGGYHDLVVYACVRGTFEVA